MSASISRSRNALSVSVSSPGTRISVICALVSPGMAVIGRMGPVYSFPMAPGVSAASWYWFPVSVAAVTVKLIEPAPLMVENRAPMGTEVLNTPRRTAAEAGYRVRPPITASISRESPTAVCTKAARCT